MLGILVQVLAGVALAALALLAVVLWRVSARNQRLRTDPSPRGHVLQLLRYRTSPPPVALEAVPTVGDTEAVVVWTTAQPCVSCVHVEQDGGDSRAYESGAPPTRYHAVRLHGLQPATAYCAHLGATGGGPTVAFTTQPAIGRVRFRFTTLTDTHFKRDAPTWLDGRLYRHGREVHERLLNQMLAYDPAFIIHKGDCSEPPGRRRLAAYGDALRRCPVPIHYIPGNHDYFHHRDFAGDWEALTGNTRTHHSFTHGGLHFALLDTCWTGEQERGFIGAAQLRWLRDDLDAHADEPTIVVTHHPIFGDAEENRVCHDAADLHAVLAGRDNVIAVLSGHVHRNLVRRDDALPGVPNIETASGIQYPIGYALYEVGERGVRQTFHTIDDFALAAASWRASWLRSVTNPSEPMGRLDDRNFVLPWPSGVPPR